MPFEYSVKTERPVLRAAELVLDDPALNAAQRGRALVAVGQAWGQAVTAFNAQYELDKAHAHPWVNNGLEEHFRTTELPPAQQLLRDELGSADVDEPLRGQIVSAFSADVTKIIAGRGRG